MILGLEIGMIVFGIIVLSTGKLTLTKNKVVCGLPARLLAIICFVPLPLSFMIGVCYGIMVGMQGRQIELNSPDRWVLTIMEAAP